MTWFKPERPLGPQLEKLFEKHHGTTIPTTLKEIARRLDNLDSLKLDLARRFTLVDNRLEELGGKRSTEPVDHLMSDKEKLTILLTRAGISCEEFPREAGNELLPIVDSWIEIGGDHGCCVYFDAEDRILKRNG
jgi:hypothetical protein